MDKVSYIALTHIHIDHGGGTSLLISNLGAKPKVIVHPKGAKHIINPEKLWKAGLAVLKDIAITMGKPEPVPSDLVYSINDNEVIDLGNVKVKAIYTPGHTPHHVCYLVKPEDASTRLYPCGSGSNSNMCSDTSFNMSTLP